MQILVADSNAKKWLEDTCALIELLDHTHVSTSDGIEAMAILECNSNIGAAIIGLELKRASGIELLQWTARHLKNPCSFYVHHEARSFSTTHWQWALSTHIPHFFEFAMFRPKDEDSIENMERFLAGLST